MYFTAIYITGRPLLWSVVRASLDRILWCYWLPQSLCVLLVLGSIGSCIRIWTDEPRWSAACSCLSTPWLPNSIFMKVLSQKIRMTHGFPLGELMLIVVSSLETGRMKVSHLMVLVSSKHHGQGWWECRECRECHRPCGRIWGLVCR